MGTDWPVDMSVEGPERGTGSEALALHVAEWLRPWFGSPTLSLVPEYHHVWPRPPTPKGKRNVR